MPFVNQSGVHGSFHGDLAGAACELPIQRTCAQIVCSILAETHRALCSAIASNLRAENREPASRGPIRGGRRPSSTALAQPAGEAARAHKPCAAKRRARAGGSGPASAAPHAHTAQLLDRPRAQDWVTHAARREAVRGLHAIGRDAQETVVVKHEKRRVGIGTCVTPGGVTQCRSRLNRRGWGHSNCYCTTAHLCRRVPRWNQTKTPQETLGICRQLRCVCVVCARAIRCAGTPRSRAHARARWPCWPHTAGAAVASA